MTETAIIDRNAEFAAERARQIDTIRSYNAAIPERRAAAEEAAAKMRSDFQARVDSGKVRDNGNGTYTVTDPGSYDDGEVWSVQRVPGFNDQELVLPESNLDETRGTAALYTRVPEWHSLGNVVPEGISDLREVLKVGGIDFEVLQTPTLYTRPDGTIAEVPNSFVNLRSDTQAALGPVGKVYTPIQNYDAGAFLQDLVERYNIVFESAGATYGGRHVFIGMRLPEDVELDLGDGVTDKIIPYLYWLGSHDGTTSNSFTVSPWRVACGNTERFNLRDAVARWRTHHTVNAMSEENLKEARRTLGLTVKYFGSFKTEQEQLARIDIQLREFEALAAEIYPKPKTEESDTKKKNWDDRMGVLTGMFGRQAGETGRTAYSAERTFTDYLDHAAPKRSVGDKLAAARATAIIEGTDDKIKTKVHEKLLLKVR